MTRRCPPGVLCIENMTILYVIVTITMVGIYFYYNRSRSTTVLSTLSENNNIIHQKLPATVVLNSGNTQEYYPKKNAIYSNLPGDVLLNPYEAPLKAATGFASSSNRGGIPINIRTRGFDTNYSQLGILTRNDGSETILPLMGRPLHTNRNKWQYYTMSDKNNSVKLPVSKNGRSATQEYGVDELFNSDSVYVEGYNDAFKVTIYDTNQPQYIPFI